MTYVGSQTIPPPEKMYMYESSKIMNMPHWTARETLQTWLKILRWGDYPGRPKAPISLKEEDMGGQRQKGHVLREAGIAVGEIWRCYPVGLENKGRDIHKPGNTGGLQNLEKANGPLLQPPEGTQPCWQIGFRLLASRTIGKWICILSSQ